MSVKLASLKADLDRESEGGWVDVPDLPGVALLVRGYSYGPYKLASALSMQRLARKYGKKPIPGEVLFTENAKLICDHLLLGWRDFDVESTPENIHDYIHNPAYRVLHTYVFEAAAEIGAVEVEFLEDAAGNSERRSDMTVSAAKPTNG